MSSTSGTVFGRSAVALARIIDIFSSFLPFHYSVCNVLRYPPPENHSPNHENSGTCHRPDQRKGTAVTDRSPSRLGLPHSISGVIYSDNPGKPDIPFSSSEDKPFRPTSCNRRAPAVLSKA